MLELTGLHRRKVCRALIWWRQKSGADVGDAARWAIALVDIAASIFGRHLSVARVTNTAVVVNVEVESDVLDRLVAKANAEMIAGAYSPMPSKALGALIGLTSHEKRAVGEILGLDRISIQAVDHDADQRDRRRKRAKKQRQEAAQAKGRRFTPREQSQSALARAADVDRSTLFRRRQKADASVSCPLPVDHELPPIPVPCDASVSCPLPGEMHQFRAPCHRLGNGHESVASSKDILPRRAMK